jgi:NADPH:quinone reductase-like Zn-dependent oxidoreductase
MPAKNNLYRQMAVGTSVAIIGSKKAHPANAGLSVEQPMNSSFAGKVILINGGTSGIGRAMAVAFAEQDPNVVVTSRRKTEVRLVDQAGGNRMGSGL